MTDETRESYDTGEVVWVKLGSSWWPGEVKNADELPSEVLDFKKPPLVIVKFFDEDSYEYVKTWVNIYPYNCEKKNEFIKKGMAAFRAKAPHMEKFPKDVLKAEETLGGNLNILSDPMFLPEKKRNYAAEVFGTPSPKTSTSKHKRRSNKSGGKKDTSHITHRRFLGADDYRAFICIQYPGKDRIPGDREDEEVLRINKEPEQDFNCHSCSFTTKRLEVMILHTKSHIKGVYLPNAWKNKQSASRRRKDKSKKKKKMGSDALDTDSDSSDSEPLRQQKKRKPKSQGARKKKAKTTEEATTAGQEPPKKDIRSELLEAWEDSDEEDLEFSFVKTNDSSGKDLDVSLSEVGPGDSQKMSDTIDKLNETDQNESTQSKVIDEVPVRTDDADKAKSPCQTIEDVLHDVSGELGEPNVEAELVKPVGEQLSTEKLLSTLEDDSIDSDDKVDKVADEEKTDEATASISEEQKDAVVETAEKSDTDDDASKHTMDKDMHEAIKSCFDFDEDDEDDSAIVGKAATGRKIPRVIPKKTSKKSTEGVESDKKAAGKDKKAEEDIDSAFKELMELTSVPDLPDVHNTLKCEQNFHNIKTVKFPDKPEGAGSPAKVERKDSTEVATKLTNPKKRFVKSFEDFELMQNEIRRREEEQHLGEPKKSRLEDSPVDKYEYFDSSEEQYSPESTIELSKLKSKIMSKIIEEAKINTESKNKIMAKIHEPKPKPQESVMRPVTADSDIKVSSNSYEKATSGHRTPRSKILESYRKDASKQKVEKAETAAVEVSKNESGSSASEGRLRDGQPIKDVVPPVRKKWSRRGSHPKKDRNLFVSQEISPETPNVDVPKDKFGETTKTEDHTSIEPEESIDDLSKIKEIILGDLKPKSSDEVLTNETMEEEAVASVEKDLGGTESQPTEEDKKEVTGELPSTDETVKEEEKLSSTEPDLTEIKEVPQEKELSIDVGDVNTVKDVGEVVEETNFGFVEEVPPTVPDTDVPAKSPLVEEKLGDEAIEAEEKEPEKEGGRAAEEEEEKEPEKEEEKVPEKEEETVPEKEEETGPEKEEETEPRPETEEEKEPKKADEIGPEKEEEIKMPVEEEADVSKPKDILLAEEDKHSSLSNIEDTTAVPLNETKTVDIDESGLGTNEISGKHIAGDSPTPSPVTHSFMSPPKDVIASPPKKSKKRKMLSDEDLGLGEIKFGTQSEPKSDDFVPLEKRKKDTDSVEEEINASLPLLESFEGTTDKSGLGGSVEVEQAIEVPQSHECDKENMCESNQIEEIQENKESSSENKDNVDEVGKLLIQDSVDIAESDKVSKENEEKVDELETDLKSLESETVELSKDIKCNKQTDPSIAEHINEVEIQCASSSVESFKFSIQTNLSILSSREEMSALALATLSEIKADLESNEDVISKEMERLEHTVVPPVLLESEMVPIEGNLTVVSEKDLADGQVEITSEQVISPKRPITLSSFSMDFSDSLSDSNSNSTTDTSSDISKLDFSSKGTEFTPKALTKQMKKVDQKKETTYGRLELINILEGNSDTERKPKEYRHPPKKSSVVDDICDFEEHIPSQIVCAKKLNTAPAVLEHEYKGFKEKEKSSKTSVKSTTSKLLERLTTESKAKASAAKVSKTSEIPVVEAVGKPVAKGPSITSTPKSTKYAVKPKPGSGSGKPIILSEQIVKPASEMPKARTKKSMEDIEDVEAFIIHKDPTKSFEEEEETTKSKSASTKSSGKAKILQQTIITAAGEIIQPTVGEVQTDDNIFDINSMPIVLSDEILTPESIEKMPIVIGSDTPKAIVPEKVVKRPAANRIITTVAAPQASPNKTITITKHKPPRILQSFGSRVVKNSPLLPNTTKPGKYIIVPQSSIPPTKYTPKKQPIVKKSPAPPSIAQKAPNIVPEPSGNKIMIVTNQQGQQQRLLLTPAQQKMLGYQSQKVTKTIVKGNVMQKSVLAAKSFVEAGTSGIIAKTSNLIGQKVMVGTSPNQGLITTTTQVVGPPGRITKAVTKRSPAASQKLATSAGKPQKTILIKNQHGQTVRKIQGTDDELLDKQVAEQLEAIKASTGMKFSSQQKALEASKATPKTPVRRFYSKRAEPKIRGPPPLAGIHQSPKPETVVAMPVLRKPEPVESKPTPPIMEDPPKTQQSERPLNQLVIQDAVGNQTTITEGQILALPSETVDGQPQSYMLVTLDESGNLTPLNSEALMSLDPNLGLGGDLSNMVLQIDQSGLSERPQLAVIKPPEPVEPAKSVEVERPPQPVPEPAVMTQIAETQQKIAPAAETAQPVPASTNGDPGQQLIVTGDPIATQKFLESLTEGTTDLANILANAEGNSILIQADGQQILINTNTDNQMLLSMNNDSVNVTENTEGGGNPIFSTQPSKNQDILAAALADTDVFQQEHPSSSVQGKIVSQLSPSNALYPMNVSNVLETSLTLSSPIMTPLEVPSTNSKKIPDEEVDILRQVPKNVDLPITITDPNISQTVANQHVSAMIANELHANLELALPISETTISTVSTEMNSPSYVYSLPALDDSVEIAQKPFNGSMPLLTEDVEETMNKAKSEAEARDKIGREESSHNVKNKGEMASDSFLAEEEGRFTLGGAMCSSLSEPPPEMFDLPEVVQTFATDKGPANIPSLQSTPDVSDNASKDGDTTDLSQADTSSEGSCEIPLQPPIVAKSMDLSRDLDSLKRSLDEGSAEAEGESKKCKFD